MFGIMTPTPRQRRFNAGHTHQFQRLSFFLAADFQDPSAYKNIEARNFLSTNLLFYPTLSDDLDHA
jgi:hypothetical protein